MDKRYTICLSIAFLVHALIVFFFQFQKMMEQRAAERRFIGVEFREEEEKKKEKKKEIKKEKKLLTPKTPTVSLKDKFKYRDKSKISEDDLKKLAQIAAPLKIAAPNKVIDIDKMLEMHKSQINIDMGDFEKLDLGNAIGDLDVITLGKGMSTEDILRQDVVELPASALSGQLGLFTTMGAGISGEGGGIELDRADGSSLVESKEVFKKSVKKADKETRVAKAEGPQTVVEITGALADRQQIKGPLPPFPDWALQRGISGYLRIKVTVDASGKISGAVIPLATTGYPNWDSAVISWVKKHWKWKAVPGLSSPGCIGFQFIIG